MARRLLVIDDDEFDCRLARQLLEPEGFEVVTVDNGPSGIEQARGWRPDLVLLDLMLPAMSGLEVLAELKRLDPALPVVVLTGNADVKMAVRATKLGAFDYMTKPIDNEEIVLVARRALEARALREELEELRKQVPGGSVLAAQMGDSPQVRELVAQVRRVAVSNFTVLIVGETGTGKELVAQALHRKSERRKKPFVALDCGAIPETLLESELFGHEKGAFTGAERRREGRFRLADGGTLFLDEIGNLPPALQPKLLRVLEDRQVQAVGANKPVSMDLRFVAASNDDLQQHVTDGRFRADLYFRVAQYTIHLPPLRERTADIPFLAERFLEEASVDLRRPVQQILPGAFEVLQAHRWPGNVRELRNVIRQAVLQTTDLVIRPETLQNVIGGRSAARSVPPVAPSSARSLREISDGAARVAERQAISEALRVAHGNKSHAAKALKTDYKTLHLKMRSLGLNASDFEN